MNPQGSISDLHHLGVVDEIIVHRLCKNPRRIKATVFKDISILNIAKHATANC